MRCGTCSSSRRQWRVSSLLCTLGVISILRRHFIPLKPSPRHLAASLHGSGTGRPSFRSRAACPGTKRPPYEQYPRRSVEQGSASHIRLLGSSIFAAMILGEAGGDALPMTLNPRLRCQQCFFIFTVPHVSPWTLVLDWDLHLLPLAARSVRLASASRLDDRPMIEISLST
jgi:hypothetical protein